MIMIDSPLTSLIQCTYIRSDLVYRISLLGEFFDFIFFTDRGPFVKKDMVDHFANQRKETPQDIDFLKDLPQSFIEIFKRDSFRKVLDKMSEELQHLPTLSITAPVELPTEQMGTIGKWARESIDPNVVLDISIDETISVGCRFVWKDILYDFSLEHYFGSHEKELYTRLTPSTPLVGHT